MGVLIRDTTGSTQQSSRIWSPWGGNNVYYAWLRTVSATGVAPLARGTAPLTSPTLASPHRQDACSRVYAPTRRRQLALAACI